jgi:hypothetical protein
MPVAVGQAVVGHGEHLVGGIARVVMAAGQEFCVLGGRELVERREGGADPDLAPGGVGEVERDKPLEAMPLDDQVDDRLGDRIKPDQR